MRRLVTVDDLRAAGLSRQQVRAGELNGRWRRMVRSVYGEGREEPTALDCARAAVVASGGVACGRLAAVLHGLDGIDLTRGADIASARRRPMVAEHVVVLGGVPCTDGALTLVDLAAVVDDLVWEQALESALRKGITTLDHIEDLAGGRRGAARVKRVLALRPPGAPSTGSLLETLMVQLARPLPDVPEPVRQLEVRNRHGDFVAIVDLAWPEPGCFAELDGQQHKDQPVYDARRQTAVSAATGWPCGRFTWHEVVHLPRATGRRLSELLAVVRTRKDVDALMRWHA